MHETIMMMTRRHKGESMTSMQRPAPKAYSEAGDSSAAQASGAGEANGSFIGQGGAPRYREGGAI